MHESEASKGYADSRTGVERATGGRCTTKRRYAEGERQRRRAREIKKKSRREKNLHKK